MHIPFVEILFFLAVALAPSGTNEIQVTAPHFSVHWVLTPQGWSGGQYDKALWTLKTRPNPPAIDRLKDGFISLEENANWTRAVVVKGGRFAGLFPVNGYVETALGRDWKAGMKIDLPLHSTVEKTENGFIYATPDGNGQERKYLISYNNDGSPYTDTVLSNYLAVSGPNFSERHEVGLRVKAKCADKLPHWTPLDDGPIPISIGQALELVRQASKEMPIPPHVDNIRLRHHVQDDEGRDFWYYEFWIASQEPHTFGASPSIGVLLDGTVIFQEPNPWPNP